MPTTIIRVPLAISMVLWDTPPPPEIMILQDKISCTHPVHPPLTPIPKGLAIGAFFFGLVTLLFRRTILLPSAYRRIILPPLIF
jgi:hypothetical protein